MDERYIDIVIDTETIEKELFKELTQLGYAPDEDELLDLVDIVFEMFLKITGAEELNIEEE